MKKLINIFCLLLFSIGFFAQLYAFDIDGDNKSDMAVWRPSNGIWYVRTSSSDWNWKFSRQWGTRDDIPLVNTDFDGDGRADMSVWRPSNGRWYVRTSSSNWNNTISRQWGTSGDIPLANTDFDGDGRADMAVWRPSNGRWYVRTSSSDWNNTISRQWGTRGDIPLANTDFDGDSRADMAVWRPSNGRWYVRTSSSNWNNTISRQWGTSGDIPFANTDFDGDGRADMAVWRPSNGIWYVRTSSSDWNNTISRQWGTSGDIPLANTDFDGDGRADMAVWRPSNGRWYVRTSSSDWNNTISRQWGTRGDIPLANTDFDGDSRADMAVWRPSNGRWYVRTSSSDWNNTISRQWGTRGDIPFGGKLKRWPKVKVVNLIPSTLSGETSQDSEPFLSVHPWNRDLMAASAFTPNPNWPFSQNAPIYVSNDGGHTWLLNDIIPSQDQTTGTGDITHAFSGVSDDLYAGILRRPSINLLMNELMTHNIFANDLMTVQNSRGGVVGTEIDQPFVQAYTVGGIDRICVGNNEFTVPGGRTATVDISLDDGANWNSVRIESRNTGTAGQNGPSIRPSIARDGTVYIAFFGWRAFNWTTWISTSDVVVVRDDNGATVTNPFQDLTDASDGLAGRLVVQNVTIPWAQGVLGQERIGSTLSIAVDPNRSSIVYLAWCDRVGTGDIYTIHVRRSLNRGVTWSNDLRTITDATNVTLAIADNGTVGLLYQQVTGTGTNIRWETHLEQTQNAFTNIDDKILATVPANTPVVQWWPYIGDYSYLIAVDSEFRGVFSANNLPDMNNFPYGVRYQRIANFATNTLDDGAGGAVAISIDPFYFVVPVMR